MNRASTQAKNGYSLSNTQRLKTPLDFKRVYQSKQWGGSAHFTYNVLGTNSGKTVLGVTVSKKVAKSAVVRNRIKRQIKEFFRLRQHEIVNANLVITAKPGCAEADDKARLDSLEVLWGKLLKWQRWSSRQRAETSDQ